MYILQLSRQEKVLNAAAWISHYAASVGQRMPEAEYAGKLVIPRRSLADLHNEYMAACKCDSAEVAVVYSTFASIFKSHPLCSHVQVSAGPPHALRVSTHITHICTVDSLQKHPLYESSPPPSCYVPTTRQMAVDKRNFQGCEECVRLISEIVSALASGAWLFDLLCMIFTMRRIIMRRTRCHTCLDLFSPTWLQVMERC